MLICVHHERSLSFSFNYRKIRFSKTFVYNLFCSRHDYTWLNKYKTHYDILINICLIFVNFYSCTIVDLLHEICFFPNWFTIFVFIYWNDNNFGKKNFNLFRLQNEQFHSQLKFLFFCFNTKKKFRICLLSSIFICTIELSNLLYFSLLSLFCN